MRTIYGSSGGERGIRTLDTGVSPYNGLAKKLSRPGARCSDSTIYVGVGRPFSGCHGLVRAQLCSKSALRTTLSGGLILFRNSKLLACHWCCSVAAVYFPDARLWIVSGLPTNRPEDSYPLNRTRWRSRGTTRSVSPLAMGRSNHANRSNHAKMARHRHSNSGGQIRSLGLV